MELEPLKRATLFIAMNDLLIEDVAVIPLVWRNEVVVVSHVLRCLELTTWDSNLSDLAYWYRRV
jgi:peptide/nickel transport system substrate-binding protein